MDQHPPELGFSFARFSDSFDLHIRQSIRGYADLMSDCVALSEFFVEADTTVFDIKVMTQADIRFIHKDTLGCSRPRAHLRLLR